ncbi:MAG TPA: tetratricopeptide repeat protein [Spirochaetota bacterium]|nr:tetratricopeptide repeat protein [Spirochaetota bacterium]
MQWKRSQNKSNNDGIDHNRIRGIEIIDEKGLSSREKFILSIALLSAIAIGSIFLIVKYFYTNPLPFISQEKQEQNTGELIQGNLSAGSLDSDNPALKKAIASYKSGYFANAITEFTDIVESSASNKDKAIALTYLGLIADKRGDYESALKYFERASSYDENPEIYLNMAKTYRNLKQYDKAISNAEKSLNLAPADINPIILLGNLHYELGDYDKALRYYEMGLKKDANNPSLLYNTALALFKKGERFQALEFLKKAAEEDKIGEIAYRSYSRLGGEFLESNMFDLAENYLKLATKLRGSDPVAHYNLGVAYLRQGKNDEALKELEEAERLSPQDMGLMEQIGESFFSLKDYDRSLRVYNKILETNSRNVKILSRIGEIYYSKGDLERAYDAYRKVTQIQPATENARIAYLNMGNILDDAQRYDDAVKAYESALAIRDNDDLTYYNLGIAYKHANQPAMAVQSWKKGISINPGNQKIRLAMADYYLERGYPDLAEKEYQEISYKWPENQESMFKLGTIYHMHKNYADAKKAYNKVIEADGTTELARKAMINLAIITSSDNQNEDNLNRSIQLIQRALLLKQDDADALLALGIIYSRKEMYEKAIETFYQSLKVSRDSKMIAECYNNIGKCYYQVKDYKRAIQAFAKAVEEDPSNEEIRLNRKTATQAYEAEIEKTR